MSLLIQFGTVSGWIVAVIHNTRKILKMFDQIIFPIARSGFFLRLATTDVASSGSDVPIATAVSPIVRFDNQNCFAISIAQLTIRSHHMMSPASHTMIKIIDFFMENIPIGSISSIAFSLLRLASRNAYIINIPNNNNNIIHSILLKICIPS